MTSITEAKSIRRGVSLTDYLGVPVLSQSLLKSGRASMAHLRAALDGAVKVKVTDAMLVGQALHTAFLEPDQAARRTAIWTGGARRGKEWEAFKADNADRVILTESMDEKVRGAVESLRRHPFAREWTSKIEAVEVSAFGEVHGAPFKARCDALTSDPLIDLKMTRSADPATFTRTAISFGYYMQGAIYRELFQRERFVLLAIEDRPPFDCVPYELAPSMLRHGEREAYSLIEQFLECNRTGVWPGRSGETITIELPGWIADQCGSGITIGGAAAFPSEEDE